CGVATRLGKMRLSEQQNIQSRRPPQVKYSKNEIYSRVRKIPEIRFEDQRLTSFAGLVIFQSLFYQLRLKERLHQCFSHLNVSPIFGRHVVVLLLIVHLLIGYRRLREIDYYRDDPMVKRLLGLNRIPDVATVSRALAHVDRESVGKIRQLCRALVIERLKKLSLNRLTLDFDGSVRWTQGRGKEGTAVGFNKKKKGARSDYPLFCTLAQTGQVFDVYYRSGNVHDSHGAAAFLVRCIEELRRELPGVKIEVRMDSAFFSDTLVTLLDGLEVEFTLSVPFERFTELKRMIEGRKRWRCFDETWSFFETPWKPKKWSTRYRFLFIRQKCKKINKEPIQLDLFIPHEYGYEFTVIVTNKQTSMKKVLKFHHGRGYQEKLFGEMKSQGQMDYIAVRCLCGNQLYLMASILAHNLTRELQMVTKPKSRGTTEKRAALWAFEALGTIRHHLLQRAGRLTEPHGKLTLTMHPNPAVKEDLLQFLEALKEAA
ncbi:MAG: IS1380 family transposase, partial [Thermodesulfobacteriota bacterium]